MVKHRQSYLLISLISFRSEQEAQRAQQEQQKVLELETLLARYREQFGDLNP